MLAAAGRRDEAVAAAKALIATALEDGDDAGVECVDTLMWAVEMGLPDAVEAVLAVPVIADGEPLVGCAIALAERARGREAQAANRIAAAFAAVSRTEVVERMTTARMLAKWGGIDWAVELYDRILAEPSLPLAEAASVSMMYSELLHDLDATRRPPAVCGACLAMTPRARDGERAVSCRACSAATCGRSVRGCTFSRPAGCPAGRCRRQPCRARGALTAYPKDVDALIALYAFPDHTADQRADALAG